MRSRLAPSSPGDLPRHFWLLWAGTFVNRAAAFVAPFLMLFLTDERGLSPAAAGAVLAVQGGGLAASNLVGGWLADRWGRRSTMLVGLTATTVIVFLLPTVRSFGMVVALVAALGLAADLHRPALNALVADAVPEEGRTRAYSLLHWAMNLGMSVAMISGGLLAEVGYHWLFRFDALTTAAFAVLIWRLLPADRVPGATTTVQAVPSGPPWWRDGQLLAFVGITVVIFAIYFQNYATLPLAVTDAGLSVRDFGLVLAVNGISVAVVQPLVAGHLGRLSQGPALAGSYLLIGAGYGLVAVAGELFTLAGTVLLWSLGEIAVVALGSAFVARLAPIEARGRYLGVYGAAIAASAAVAPLAGTAVYQWNSAALWAGCFVVAAVMAIWQLMLRPVRRPAAPADGSTAPLAVTKERA